MGREKRKMGRSAYLGTARILTGTLAYLLWPKLLIF